jgi:septum formation protein
MIWHYSGKSLLKMRNLEKSELENYLSKIDDVTLKSYGVYQIEAGGEFLFERIEGDRENIMGLPIKQIKQYLKTL